MQPQTLAGADSMSIYGRLSSESTSVLRPGMRPPRFGNGGTYFIGDEAKKSAGIRIFVSDAANNDIDILNGACKLVGQIPGFSEPQGLAVDKDDSLYVADTGLSDVVVYAKPYNRTPRKLGDPGQYPVGVAVDDNFNVAAANIISTSNGAGSVTFYDKTGKQGKTISNSSFARVYFDAFDRSGNLFLDGEDSNGDAVVGEIVGGYSGKSIKVLTTDNSIEFPGGIEVNKSNQPVIDDQVALALYTYEQPKNGSLGSPVSSTSLDASDPVEFALTSTDRDLWVGDAGSAGVPEYPYPKGGSPTKTCLLQGWEPIGVAVLPPNLP